MIDAEQGLRSFAGDALQRVNELLAFVVPAARIALGVLVREDGPAGLEHCHRNVILRRDETNLLPLTARLGLDQFGNVRVATSDMRNGRLVHGVLLSCGTNPSPADCSA